MKKLILIASLFLSAMSYAEIRDEVHLTSKSEIRKFLLNPHSYIDNLAATKYLNNSSSANDLMKKSLKDYLTGSYHLSRVNTGSEIKSLEINLSYFNRANSDSRIFVHFEYTNDSNSADNYHRKYVTFSDGNLFLSHLIKNHPVKIKGLDACKQYYPAHPLKCD